jgi:hypothetical protein
MTTASDDGAKGPIEFSFGDGWAMRLMLKGMSAGDRTFDPLGCAGPEHVIAALTANPQLRAEVLSALQAESESENYWHIRGEGAERREKELRDLLRAVESELAAERARVRELTDIINVDRTGLAAGLNHVVAVVKGYQWIADRTWGNYSYEQHTVETLQREVGWLIEGACNAAARALKVSGERASKAVRGPSPPVASVATAEQAAPATVACWSCGKMLPADYKRCGRCNQEPDEPAVEQAAPAAVEQPERMLGPDAKLRAEIVAAAREAGAAPWPWAKFAELLEGKNTDEGR